jgi:hypothetical protein
VFEPEIGIEGKEEIWKKPGRTPLAPGLLSATDALVLALESLV